MQPLQFFKVLPGGNATIIFHGLFPSTLSLPDVSATLMAQDYLGAEQAGYLSTTTATPHLQMMGNEFCLNATRAATLVLAHHNLLTPINTHVATTTMTVSGAASPLQVFMGKSYQDILAVATAATPASGVSTLTPPNKAHTAVCLTFTQGEITVVPLDAGIHLVHMPGISHLLIDSCMHPIPSNPTAYTQQARQQYALHAYEASGVVWYTATETNFSITPFVYVTATQTEYAETACGSASLALAYLNQWQTDFHSTCHLDIEKNLPIAITQPSQQQIYITFLPANQSENASPVFHALAGGETSIVCHGTVYI